MILKLIRNMIQVKRVFNNKKEATIVQTNKIRMKMKMITMRKKSIHKIIPNRIFTEKILWVTHKYYMNMI